MGHTFLGINLGVGKVKVILVDEEQNVLSDSVVRLTRSSPHPRWFEQSPEEWWSATSEAIASVRAHVPAAFSGLRGIGISGQTQGTVLLDKHHRLLRPAMLWRDGRALAECVELEALVTNSRDITGNVAKPGFTAAKLLWLQKYERSVFDSIAKVLTPKDFIVFRLTGEFVTDMSDASATLCFDVTRRSWSERMIEALGLSCGHFPKLAEGSEVAGLLRPQLALAWQVKHPVPVAAGAAYPAAAAVGLGMREPGAAHIDLGQSGLVFVTSNRAYSGKEQAVGSFCHALPKRWCRLGVVPSGSASLDWSAPMIGVRSHESFIEQANQADVHEAPTFLPYLYGASSLHSDARASGVFFGLTQNTGKRELAYAVLEGVAFSMADSLVSIQKNGAKVSSVSLIGNGRNSRFWSELLVTACNTPMNLHDSEFDAPSIGAVRLAQLSAANGSAGNLFAAPPVVETIEPREDWGEEIEIRRARFRRVHQALKSEFAIQEPRP